MHSVRCSVTRTVMLGLLVVHGALVHGAHSTPFVQSATARRGLSGVIGDTTFQAIAGARIHVVGSDARAETIHDGTFLLPLQPGRYLVEVAHAAFAQQLIGVTVPADSGRRLALWPSPSLNLSTFR